LPLLKSIFANRRAVAGFVRGGVFVLLGLFAALLVSVAATPKPSNRSTTPPGKNPAALSAIFVHPTTPDGAWQWVTLTPDQQRAFVSLRADLRQAQRETVRLIQRKAGVLRRELRIAESKPAQKSRAVWLRQEIRRLTAPLEENHAEFEREARALLTAEQKQLLEAASVGVKVEKLSRPSASPRKGGVR